MAISPAPYSKDYEITDAMFGAFRSPGGAAFFWKLTALLTGVYTVIFLLLLPPLVKSYGRMILASLENDTGVALSESLLILPLVLLLVVATICANATIRAAFYRSYFFNAPTTGFPLEFGQDEIRQILSSLGFYGIIIGLSIVVGFVIGFVTGFLAVLVGESAAVLIGFLMFILTLALIIILYWAMLRLCPAGALSALRGTTHVLAARHVSKGRAWALLGSILVAGLIGYVVYYILSTIGILAGLSGLITPDMFSALSAGDSDTLVETAHAAMEQAGFKVGVVIAIIAMSSGAAFYQMMLVGPQAYFTWQWAEASDLKPLNYM